MTSRMSLIQLRVGERKYKRIHLLYRSHTESNHERNKSRHETKNNRDRSMTTIAIDETESGDNFDDNPDDNADT